MRTAYATALAILLAASLAGCRQADGPIPTPTEERQNDIGDIARDMINVINGAEDAAGELSEDLSRYSPSPEANEAATELARRLADALPGARLDDDTAMRLAHSLWVAVSATELSSRQIQVLENDIKGTLVSAGVEEARADGVAQQVGEVQRVITRNPRRWYQVF